MRSDTPLCYPVGEPCDQGLLFDERHEAILIGALDLDCTWLSRPVADVVGPAGG